MGNPICLATHESSLICVTVWYHDEMMTYGKNTHMVKQREIQGLDSFIIKNSFLFYKDFN